MRPRERVFVCFGDSITAMGWPELTAALLPVESGVALVNRGVSGNRLLFDASARFSDFGRSGLSRFDDDVLGTVGATDVIIALGTNDLGHPGATAPLDELPSAADLIGGYGRVIDRASAAGLAVAIATITPFLPATGYDDARDAIRAEVNDWIRSSAPSFVDFDAALRSNVHASQLAEGYDMGDHLHPNEAGQARLAQEVAEFVARS